MCVYLCVCGLYKSNNRCTHVATSTCADISSCRNIYFLPLIQFPALTGPGLPRPRTDPQTQRFFPEIENVNLSVTFWDLLPKGEPFHMASISKLASLFLLSFYSVGISKLCALQCSAKPPNAENSRVYWVCPSGCPRLMATTVLQTNTKAIIKGLSIPSILVNQPVLNAVLMVKP